MLFNSIHYFIFAPLVIGVYFLLKGDGRRWLLLVSSLYFYAVFRVPFILVLLFSIAITHVAARGIDRMDGAKGRRSFLLLGILGNLAILFFLKYIDFSIKAFNQLLGLESCDSLHLQPWGVILPMGISFFTLQAIAYVVDVYRRTIQPTRSIFHFALFLSFFPQLVAGPIMRAGDLLHQFAEEHHFRFEDLRIGLRWIALGLFKKTMVADQVGVIVDRIFGAPHNYGWIGTLVGSFLFILQIYCDFSGYSDVAIGSGRILGFRIPLNFNRPLLADSMTDLWRRWHISLSSWLRDYIYIPLGGSRVSRSRIFLNATAAMVVGGIWHGADWTFLIWGLSHAVVLLLERLLLSFPTGKRFFFRIPRAFRIFYTVALFSILGILFRAQPVAGNPQYQEGLQVALVMFHQIFTLAPGAFPVISAPVLLAMGLLALMEILEEFKPELGDRLFARPAVDYITAFSVIGFCFLVYSVTESPQFIYFQF